MPAPGQIPERRWHTVITVQLGMESYLRHLRGLGAWWRLGSSVLQLSVLVNYMAVGVHDVEQPVVRADPEPWAATAVTENIPHPSLHPSDVPTGLPGKTEMRDRFFDHKETKAYAQGVLLSQ
jgi:hypothetical protein